MTESEYINQMVLRQLGHGCEDDYEVFGNYLMILKIFPYKEGDSYTRNPRRRLRPCLL